MPYGFPSARKLKGMICDEFSNDRAAAVQALSTLCMPHQFVEFCRALRFSGQNSVDAFLERNPDYIPVGKFAIAYCLIGFEREDDLFPPNPEQHLYEYIFSQLGGDVQRFGENKLSVLTFNYDRSLEHFLETALFNSNSKTTSREDVWAALGHVPIIHLYGQLAPLPWQERQYARQYEHGASAQNVARAAQFIKIISEKANEDLEDDSEFQQAWEIIEKAKQICFLGFGYHRTNLERLRIDNSNGRWNICGTARGLEYSEKTRVIQMLGNATLDAIDSMQLLRHYGLLQ